MSQMVLSIVIALAGVIVSVGAAVFVSGERWGRVVTDIEYIKRDQREIREMFTLVLIDSPKRKD